MFLFRSFPDVDYGAPYGWCSLYKRVGFSKCIPCTATESLKWSAITLIKWKKKYKRFKFSFTKYLYLKT